MLSLGVAGFGALAIVAGANVIPAIPGAIDLLLVHRFRPVRAGSSFSIGGAIKLPCSLDSSKAGPDCSNPCAARSRQRSLPLQLGFAALGLLQRAQSLFLATVGQVNSIFAETVYPLLPKHAAEPERYRTTATLFLQVVFWIVLPGAVFVAWQGKAVLRVLYGERWIAADPLIAPGAAIGAAVCLFGAGYNILLAKTDLKRCVLLDVTVALATAPSSSPSRSAATWSLMRGRSARVSSRPRSRRLGWQRGGSNRVGREPCSHHPSSAPPWRSRIARHPWPRELAAHRPTAMPRIPLPLHHGSRHPRTLPSVLVATMQGVPGGHVSVGGFGCLRGSRRRNVALGCGCHEAVPTLLEIGPHSQKLKSRSTRKVLSLTTETPSATKSRRYARAGLAAALLFSGAFSYGYMVHAHQITPYQTIGCRSYIYNGVNNLQAHYRWYVTDCF